MRDAKAARGRHPTAKAARPPTTIGRGRGHGAVGRRAAKAPAPRRRPRRRRRRRRRRSASRPEAAAGAVATHTAGRGRGPQAPPVEPRQGAVPRGGYDQGRGHRLLRPHRADDGAAPGDRGVTLRRFPNGVDGGSFFEKRCPAHRPEWLGTVLGPGDRNGNIQLLLPRLGRRAGVGGQHGGASRSTPRWRCVRHRDADDVRVRPRPGRRRRHRRVRGRGARRAPRARRVRAGGLPQDVGVEGHAGLRAAQRGRTPTSRRRRSPRRWPSCWSGPIPTPWCRT